MLFEIRKILDDKGRLTLSDAYGFPQGKSATTGCRKLLSLRDMGLVTFAVLDCDKRQRSLHFTHKAHQF